jgi:hypothetical protein
MYVYKYNLPYILFIGGKPMAQELNNPLRKYFRQPKIFLTLPSKGNFYPKTALDMPQSNELPIYPLTAKDEMLMKTPDALLNGEATVEVIRSCVPNILDPWSMPQIDLDAVMIAIRLATYGENLTLTTKVPVIEEERDYDVNLRELLDQLIVLEYQPFVDIDDGLVVEIRPMTYKEFTVNAQKTFQEQRIFKIVGDETIPDDEKLVHFNSAFRKLTDFTIELFMNSVVSIDTAEGKVTDKNHIKEFFNSADKKYFDKVMRHIENMRKASSIKPLVIKSPQLDIDQGVPEQYEVPITFDQSNFFV